MKYISLLLLILCISCSKNETIKTASLQIEGVTDPYIIVTHAIDDVTFWTTNKDTIYPDQNGVFNFQKNIEKAQFATVQFTNERRNLILIPEEQVQLTQQDSSIQFVGLNHKGQELLNTMSRPHLDMNEYNKWISDTTAAQIKDKIGVLLQPELNNIDVLQSQNKISVQFATILKQEVNYFYALRTLQLVYTQFNIKGKYQTLYCYWQKKHYKAIHYKLITNLQIGMSMHFLL